MTAEEAVRQAEAAGLTLLKAASSSGYKGVAFHNGSTRNLTKPYAATETRGGKTVSLGYFVTAEEAALCIARREKRAAASAAAAAPPPMTAEEAVRQADVEGLTLQKSDNKATRAFASANASRAATSARSSTRRLCSLAARPSPAATTPRPRRRQCAGPAWSCGLQGYFSNMPELM